MLHKTQKTWIKRGITLVLAAALMLSLHMPVGVAAAENNTPKLIFSGVTMQTKGESVQGFLDFKVKNVENNGVHFTLEYDTDYVVLSKADSNAEHTQPPLGMDINPGYLRLNGDILTADNCMATGVMEQGSDKYDSVDVNVMLKDEAEVGEYIGEKTLGEESFQNPVKVIKAANRELFLGQISFLIKDPAGFAKLTNNELGRVFRIKTTDTGGSAFQISAADLSTYPPIVFYDQSQNLEYEFHVENTMSAVTLNTPQMTVTAAEIYDRDSEADLLTWLNTYMNDVTISYADGTEIADSIVWGAADKGFTQVGEWNVKGGDYTFTQSYNDDFTVSAQLTVKPVNVISYTTDSEIVAFPTADDVPASIDSEDMKMPTKAHPVFDQVIPGDASYVVGINLPWRQTAGPNAPAGSTSDFFTDKAEGEYTFTAEPNTADLPRWASYENGGEVNVTRGIGAQTDMPEVEASVADDGTMTINVNSIGSLSPLPADGSLSFIIKTPNGEVIDPAAVIGAGGVFTVSYNSPDAGKAVIKIKAGDTSDAFQQRLAQQINLGARAGSFAISAKNGTQIQSGYNKFDPTPRKNYYLPASGSAGYSFDYSGGKASLLALSPGMTEPPATITLAAGDSVRTTYSGNDGTEPGTLDTITVEEWTTTDSIAPGASVTFTGILKDGAEYTNYGIVNNPDNVTVTLKLIVNEEEEEKELIADIENFVFSKKQEGYPANNLQTQSFNIENIGNVDILGTHISIDTDDFIIKGSPRYRLRPGDSDSFSISPKAGLKTGVYTATVTVGSNRTAELDTFVVSFEVTEKPVYDLVLTVNDTQAGTAEATNGYAYAAGDEVELTAKVNTDYRFVNWTVINDGISIAFNPSDSAEKVTFTMPDMAAEENKILTVQANFDQTTAAKLRLSELRIMETDEAETENDLLDENYKKTLVKDSVLSYYVLVGSDSEENKAYIKLKDTSVNVTVTASISTAESTEGQALTVTARVGDSGAYDISAFPLVSAPTVNELKITLTAADEPDTKRSYSVKILRKMPEDKLVSLNYGNSPYGLIMKNVSEESDRTAWKQAFDQNNSFTSGFTPTGGHEGLVYHSDAWGNAYNYDKDDYALFVYSGETLEDPGVISAVNSIGGEVKAEDIKREVTLIKLSDNSALGLAEKLREIEEVKYTIDNTGQSEALVQNNIRPGIYSIEYTFKDFDGSTVTKTRPLIVLYRRGDVDLSGAANNTDAELIANRFKVKLPYGNLPGYEAGSLLCLYRICDVNTDRNINAGDANYIRSGMAGISQFYE